MRIAVLSVLLLLAGCGGASSSAGSLAGTRALPASYRFVLDSSCGERSLVGRYDVVVRDRRVVGARQVGSPHPSRVRLGEVPTLEDLLVRAARAEPRAVVDLRLDGDGIPRSLSIDHDPRAIDDEECYRVSRVRPTH